MPSDDGGEPSAPAATVVLACTTNADTAAPYPSIWRAIQAGLDRHCLPSRAERTALPDMIRWALESFNFHRCRWAMVQRPTRRNRQQPPRPAEEDGRRVRQCPPTSKPAAFLLIQGRAREIAQSRMLRGEPPPTLALVAAHLDHQGRRPAQRGQVPHPTTAALVHR